MTDIVVHMQVTPESLGFKPGTRHPIFGFDYYMSPHWKAGEVEVVKVADNFLLSVVALVPINDAESGDFYPAGTVFTAWFGHTADGERVLTFIPCGPDEDEDDSDD